MTQGLIRTMKCPREPNETVRCWLGRELYLSPGCHILRGDVPDVSCPFDNLCRRGMHSKQWLAGLPALFCRDIATSGRLSQEEIDTHGSGSWLDVWCSSNIVFHDNDMLKATQLASAFATAVLFRTEASPLLWIDVTAQKVPASTAHDADDVKWQRRVLSVPVLIIDGMDNVSRQEKWFLNFVSGLIVERVKSGLSTCFVTSSNTIVAIQSFLFKIGVLSMFRQVTVPDVEIGQTPLLDEERKHYYKNAIEMCTKHNLTFGSFWMLMDVSRGYQAGVLENRLRKSDVERARQLGLLPKDLVVRQPYDDLPDYLDNTFTAGISSP